MKYEFIFKVRPYKHASYEVKYRAVVEAKRFNSMKSTYERLQREHEDWDSVILINELTDFNEFIRTIQ